jgi:hypothetical protein
MPKGGLSFPADAHIATAIEDSGKPSILDRPFFLEREASVELSRK